MTFLATCCRGPAYFSWAGPSLSHQCTASSLDVSTGNAIPASPQGMHPNQSIESRPAGLHRELAEARFARAYGGPKTMTWPTLFAHHLPLDSGSAARWRLVAILKNASLLAGVYLRKLRPYKRQPISFEPSALPGHSCTQPRQTLYEIELLLSAPGSRRGQNSNAAAAPVNTMRPSRNLHSSSSPAGPTAGVVEEEWDANTKQASHTRTL